MIGLALGLLLAASTAPPIYTGDVAAPAWSPRRAELAYERLTGPTQSIVVGGRAVATLHMLPYYPFEYEWSPDGEQIAYSDYVRLFVRRVQGGGPPTRLAAGAADHVGSLRDFAWSPDGGRVAYVANNRIATIEPDGTGRLDLSSLLKQNGAAVFGTPDGLAWSPDSQRLAFDAWTIPPLFKGDTRVTWVAEADGSGLERMSSTARTCCAAWSRDGVLASTGDKKIRVVRDGAEWLYERSAGAPRWSSRGLIAADGIGGIHVITRSPAARSSSRGRSPRPGRRTGSSSPTSSAAPCSWQAPTARLRGRWDAAFRRSGRPTVGRSHSCARAAGSWPESGPRTSGRVRGAASP